MTGISNAAAGGKRNISHRFEAVTCQACGRKSARKSRQQKYCNDRCRQFALRENKARTGVKNAPGYQGTGPVTNPHKLASKNKGLKEVKSGSSIPLNLLGGYVWQSTVILDRELVNKIIHREIGGVL